MQIDNTSLSDLGIFHADEDQSVLNKLNFCRTNGGRHWLKYILSNPHSDVKPILATQETLKLIQQKLPEWPNTITNGTIMVIQRLYDSQIDTIPAAPGVMDALLYRIFHSVDYGLLKYSVGHVIDFVKEMKNLQHFFNLADPPAPLKKMMVQVETLLRSEIFEEMYQSKKESISGAKMLRFGSYILTHSRNKINQLIDIYSQLDAYYSLAKASAELNLQFPVFTHDERPYISSVGLFHILLKKPISYHLEMSHDNNFIFLTGANMAGKSTFIKSVGLAVYLAHIGMAVPAQSMELTVFNGLLSNIQVADNIIKGESYFFNEVQRIKNTILKINDGQKWLVLIDELFKGTNVQDAMRCSSAVIKGLLKIQNSLFILSTHLYEIGEELRPYPNIAFRYFETMVTDSQLEFSYQLKEGISNDRLGYLILKREGVVEMIDSL